MVRFEDGGEEFLREHARENFRKIFSLVHGVLRVRVSVRWEKPKYDVRLEVQGQRESIGIVCGDGDIGWEALLDHLNPCLAKTGYRFHRVEYDGEFQDSVFVVCVNALQAEMLQELGGSVPDS